MIITDKLIFINFPKTGSTFVRETLKKIHNNYSLSEKILFKLKIKKKPFFKVLWLPNIREKSFRYGTKDEHGLYCQIPKELLKNRKVISVKRNLFEFYISLYEYGDWKKTWKNTEYEKIYNNFPNLTFEQFMNIMLNYNMFQDNPQINGNINIGNASTQFVLFYFKNPFEIVTKIDDKYISQKQYKKDMADIIFLNQKTLNQDLYDILLNNGYPRKKIKFILTAPKINVSKPDNKTISDYFSKDMIEKVKEKEKLLYSIFGEYYV